MSKNKDVNEDTDVDALLETYKKSRSKIVFLVLSIVFFLLSIIGGTASINAANDKLASTTESAVQMAELSIKYCTKNFEPKCIKAEEIIKDPNRAHFEGTPTTEPVDDTVVDYFKNDPVPQMLSLVMTVAIGLRVQLNPSVPYAYLRRKIWN